ncbi:MAG: hypothetical protein ACLSVD_12320 [Eggerthellaceae bacterium]
MAFDPYRRHRQLVHDPRSAGVWDTPTNRRQPALVRATTSRGYT